MNTEPSESMKDFADYLKESASTGICWWIRQPHHNALKELVYFCYERFETVRYDYNMIETDKIKTAYDEYRKKFAVGAPDITKEIWMVAVNIGEHFKLGVDADISQSEMNTMKRGLKSLIACPSRASWSWFDGLAYRGTTLGLDDFKNVKFDNVAFVGGGNYLITDITYKSRYEGQSWTYTFSIAETFAKTSSRFVRDRTNKSRVMAIMEAHLSKQETLFNRYASSALLSAVIGSVSDEDEVIRLSNTPLRCKVYIPVRAFVAMMQNIPGGYGADPEWAKGNNRTTVWDWKKEDEEIFMRHFSKYFSSPGIAKKAFKVLPV